MTELPYSEIHYRRREKESERERERERLSKNREYRLAKKGNKREPGKVET